MKTKTTITIEDAGAPTTDFVVIAEKSGPSIEIAGCRLPLSAAEALKISNSLAEAAYCGEGRVAMGRAGALCGTALAGSGAAGESED